MGRKTLSYNILSVCKQINEYKKLIKAASVHELHKYDVILCTCATSASPRLTTGANISQIIIDEGGMCMEPECLIPLVSFKDAQQVVLIGDHKQLQPIVFNTVAKNLGLGKSLFERYKDRALMLDEQYRMVRVEQKDHADCWFKILLYNITCYCYFKNYVREV